MGERRCFGCMELVTEAVCPHCGCPADFNNEPHQLAVGTVFRDQYVVGRVLGQGGFGITYLGWDLDLGRRVAIKEFYPSSMVNRDSGVSSTVRLNIAAMEPGYVQGRDRFLREAKALAKLMYVPEIVSIFATFQQNYTAYIVMEYIKGTELSKYVRMRGGKLEVTEAIRILDPIAKALERVHAEDLVHRDISPDNIILHPMGGAKLLDFGAVRTVENPTAGKDLSHSTEAIVKHGFAPPEQYRNRGGLGPWTDCYAFCATFYYCVTGTMPPDALSRSLYNEQLDWSRAEGVTAEQLAALEKGLALSAKDRYDDMRQLRLDLRGDLPITEINKQEAAKQLAADEAARQVFTGSEQPAHKRVSRKTEETRGNQPKQEQPSGEKVSKPLVKQRTEENRPEQNQSSNKTKSPVKLIAAVAAVAAVVLAAVLVLRPNAKPDNDTKPGAEAVQNQSVAMEPVQVTQSQEYTVAGTPQDGESTNTSRAWENNQLIYDPLSRLTDDKTSILTVTFRSELDNVPDGAVKLCNKSEGSVMGWIEDGHVTIAAAGEINAKDACEGLFSGCTSLTQVFFNGVFNTSQVESMEEMFYDCPNLSSVDTADWDTGNVRSMRRMFWSCSSVRKFETEQWNVSNVTDMNGMFAHCAAIRSVDVGNWDVGNVKDMEGMFYDCGSLVTLDAGAWNMSSVEYAQWMFRDCGNLQSLDVSRWDMRSVKNLEYMFFRCRSIEKLEVGNWEVPKNAQVNKIFAGCDSLLNVQSFKGW